MLARLCFFLFLAVLFANQFQVFPSGLPQPADALMALLILLVATGFVVRVPLPADLVLSGALFVAYFAFVNLFWWFAYSSNMLLLPPLYYLFNVATFFTVLAIFTRWGPEFITKVRLVLGVALLVQVAIVLVGAAEVPGERHIGSFNNPNQLGYWTLLTATCFMVLKGSERVGTWDVVVLGASAALVSMSLSKAAIVAFLMLGVMVVACQGFKRSVKVGLIGALLLSAIVLTLQSEIADDLVSAPVVQRLSDIGGQRDDTLDGRGYDRLWLYPQYLILGAGEGGYGRFTRSVLSGRELHSSFGTLLFSYGIAGLSLFALFLWRVFAGARLSCYLYVVPLFAYGATHHGLRDTLLWVFLALVAGTTRYQRLVARPGPAPPQPMLLASRTG